MSETRQSMVTVAESGSGPYSQLVHAGRHVLSADEPEARCPVSQTLHRSSVIDSRLADTAPPIAA
jgi:hypothetical protein